MSGLIGHLALGDPDELPCVRFLPFARLFFGHAPLEPSASLVATGAALNHVPEDTVAVTDGCHVVPLFYGRAASRQYESAHFCVTPRPCCALRACWRVPFESPARNGT